MKVAEGSTKEKIYQVRVFYNETRDEQGRHLGMVRGYEDGDDIRFVVDLNITTETPEERRPKTIANAVYRQMNHVDGTELIAAKPHLRSMSVGDVVMINDSNGLVAEFAVDNFGWKELS